MEDTNSFSWAICVNHTVEVCPLRCENPLSNAREWRRMPIVNHFLHPPKYFLSENKVDLGYSQLVYGIGKAVFTLCFTSPPGWGATSRCAGTCLHLTPTHSCVPGSLSPGLSQWCNSYLPFRFSLEHFSAMKSLPTLADQTDLLAFIPQLCSPPPVNAGPNHVIVTKQLLHV